MKLSKLCAITAILLQCVALVMSSDSDEVIQAAVHPTGYANPSAGSSVASVLKTMEDTDDSEDFFDAAILKRREEMLRENEQKAAEAAASAIARQSQENANRVEVDAQKDTNAANLQIPKKEKYDWANTEETSLMWRIINQGTLDNLKAYIRLNPDAVHQRSEDGRGALWWAYEYGKKDMVEALISWGVSTTDTDASGKTPAMMEKSA